jgi:rhamnulokinase
MKKLNVVAVDLGASNGRTILGVFNGKTIELNELNRFGNEYVQMSGDYYWDIVGLYSNIVKGIKAYSVKTDEVLSCIGIDTWGVDFALIDNQGRLINNARSYRDSRGKRGMDAFVEKIGIQAAFNITGISNYEFNTLFQLYDMVLNDDASLKIANKLLLLPDYLGYVLCGEISTEFTNATTTQMLDRKTGDWSDELANMVGVQRSLLPKIQMAGEKKGVILKTVIEETGLRNSPDIICIGSHDTASAFASIPSESDSCAFISSGTWSLIGVASKSAVVNNEIFNSGLSNEGTVTGEYNLLKNIMGMWLIQNCKKQWENEGKMLNWTKIVILANQAAAFRSFINIDDRLFYDGNDPINKIKHFCRVTDQPIPNTIGEIARTVYESMAMCYREALEQLESATDKKIDMLHIVGGGAQNKLLNQLTANAIGKEVVAGPVEATAIGNVMMQLKAINEIDSVNDIRKIITNSFDVERFDPKKSAVWEEQYGLYQKIKEEYDKQVEK